jgi:hypothetical protein
MRDARTIGRVLSETSAKRSAKRSRRRASANRGRRLRRWSLRMDLGLVRRAASATTDQWGSATDQWGRRPTYGVGDRPTGSMLDRRAVAHSGWGCLGRGFSPPFRAGLYPLIAGRRRAPRRSAPAGAAGWPTSPISFLRMPDRGAPMAPAPGERSEVRGRRVQHPDRGRTEIAAEASSSGSFGGPG